MAVRPRQALGKRGLFSAEGDRSTRERARITNVAIECYSTLELLQLN